MPHIIAGQMANVNRLFEALFVIEVSLYTSRKKKELSGKMSYGLI